MASRKAMLGIVDSHEKAGDIVASLRLHGFPASLLSILFASELGCCTHDAGPLQEPRERFGGAVGFFGNVTTMAVRGVGPTVVGGALVQMLEAEPHGLLGCLTSLGISMLEARQCERDLRAKNILVAVHVDHPAERAAVRKTLEQHDAAAIGEREEITAPSKRAA